MKYPGTESSTLEFKKHIPTKSQIIHTVVGFCNLYGGRLVLGVSDDGTIAGVLENNIPETLEALSQSIYQSCTPPILPEIYTQRIQNKLIIIIEVSSGMNKPYFVTSEGMLNGTYVRIGSVTMKATPQLIEELRWRSRGYPIDLMPVYLATLHALDEDGFLAFLKNRRVGHRKAELKPLLMHYDLVVEEHKHLYPTLAGVLLFGYEPQRYLPEAFVICSHFKGIKGREALASKDCTGTLFQQLEDAYTFVTNCLNKQYVIKGLKRQEQLEIPAEALREVLMNAIVHRHYQTPGPIKVAVYEDRVEVFSPGNFPGPLKVDQLEMGITYIRNAAICKVFREAGLIEKLGSGFLTLFESYRERGLPPPQVSEGAGFVKCILPRLAAAKKHKPYPNEPYQELMRLFNITDQISASDVVAQLSVSRQTATRILAKLVAENRLIKVGKGAATRYKRV